MSIIGSFYNDNYDRLTKWGLEVAKSYVKDQGMVKSLIVNSEAYRYLLKEAYTCLVIHGELTRIESLDNETKINLWERAQKWCPEERNKNKIIEISKCIWLLADILEKREKEIYG